MTDVSFRFTGESGTVDCARVDMDLVRALVAEWEAENLPPEPPDKTMTPSMFKFKETRQAHLLSQSRGITMDEAERIVASEIGTYKDEKDPEYLEQMQQWEWRRYLRTEEILWVNSVLFDFTDGTRGTLASAGERRLSGDAAVNAMKMIVSGGDRFALYSFIVENSELTWGAVVAAAQSLGIKRHGRPILETVPSDGGEAQALTGLGAIAAKNQGITPVQYKKLPVPEQAAVLAVDLCDRWAQYYAAQDNMERQKNARTNGNQTSPRRNPRRNR